MAHVSHRKEWDVRVARSYSLRKMFEQHLETDTAPLSIMYEYGLGPCDGWEHQTELLGVASSTERADRGFPEKQQTFCYDVQGHPIAENCGGVEEWKELKAAFADPERRYGQDARDLYKGQLLHSFSMGTELDPHAFDLVFINSQLKHLGR